MCAGQYNIAQEVDRGRACCTHARSRHRIYKRGWAGARLKRTMNRPRRKSPMRTPSATAWCVGRNRTTKSRYYFFFSLLSEVRCPTPEPLTRTKMALSPSALCLPPGERWGAGLVVVTLFSEKPHRRMEKHERDGIIRHVSLVRSIAALDRVLWV